MSTYSRLLSPFVLALALGAPSLAAQRLRSAAPLYELVVLDEAATTRVGGVSTGGLVTGVRTDAGVQRAFVWSARAGHVRLDPLAGFPWSGALRANAAGFVLGASFSPSAQAATLWSPTGVALELPDLGWTMTTAMALSDAGVVVGNGHTTSGWRPWIWDATNGTRLLSALGLPAGCTVTDVNAAGVVAANPSFGEAFLFDLASAGSTPLGTLGGDTSRSNAVNELGHAAGSSWAAASNDPSPCFWSPATGMLSLGTPSGAGFAVGAANDLDEAGRVVGWFRVGANEEHAFVWDRSSGMRDLNDLARRGGVELRSAHSISSRGWIAGNAIDRAAGGKLVGFVLRPY